MKNKYQELGFAKVDLHRHLRKGFPEVIYCEGKTPQQVAKIAQVLNKKGHSILATRANKKTYLAVKKVFKKAKYYELAKIITVQTAKNKLSTDSAKVAVITAGTADIPVAEEAAVTAEFLGNKVDRIYDVGVAGIHRLIENLDRIKEARVIIVVAGMEGALASVIGGLVDKPIIAVPTSVGYGASFQGLSALLTMLNSCAPGIGVVNIDNGFGAAVLAHYIVK